ncbi:MAG: 3-isopropylmalate dehydratase large subunit [Anaerolineae bacterium]|nr:3-isopropylmalate dehydratase large subunit [Thermoflexales bacterium]MDW8406346.1 3-isopropylmalate dehydratase large subunit [Anaerolineae bacterium]
MGKTFAEKALARASGQPDVTAGQIVDARPDRILSHDNTAAIYRLFKQLGVEKVKHPERLAVTLDHAVPAPTTQHAQNHAEARRFVAEQGVTHFFEVGRGICHQVLSEEALVLPGQLILGADSHTTHYGWLGAFGAGVGRSEVAALWATGELWLRVPESIKIVLNGELPFGVTAKDFCLKLIGDLGADGGLYASIEFHGDGIRHLSLESRMVIPNMMAEFGAKNAYLSPDEAVFAYLAERLERRKQREAHESGKAEEREDWSAVVRRDALYPDADAVYIATHVYDASTLEPMIAKPHRVDNVVPLSEVRGVRVQQAFLGTCTNGRLEDLAAACAVLQGKRIARGTRMVVIPASSEVLQEATRLGYISTFLEAGAVIGVPGCGPCMGNHMGIPAPNEVTISSANRNFRGRMGTRESEIYLASPAVVAASAVAGYIADPRDV